MDIYIVQPGDTLESIAERFGVSATRLALDNNLTESANLVLGQTIVILYPRQVYIVKENDTLQSIADAHNIPLMQLLRNNPYLSDREFIYPGELLVISYNNNKGLINTIGFASPFIDRNVLTKILPFLTYVTIYGYQAKPDGSIGSVEDSMIISLAKEYGVAPLLILSTFTLQGVENIETYYIILENEGLINRQIDNIIDILNEKGLFGVLIAYQFISEDNIALYESYTDMLAARLHDEGYRLFVSITPFAVSDNNQVTFPRLDYSNIGRAADKFVLINYTWGQNFGPPLPITSISITEKFLEYIVNQVPPDKLILGIPSIGYDWEIPYTAGISSVRALSVNSAVNLARSVGAIINFDEVSYTPFFEYTVSYEGSLINHIVWFIDARTVDAAIRLARRNRIPGIGVWNIMYYYAQLWLVINSQYQIEKIFPEP